MILNQLLDTVFNIKRPRFMQFQCNAMRPIFPLSHFLATGNFCHLLIPFANSLETDVRGPTECRSGSGSKPFVTEIFGKKLTLEKVSRQQQKHKKLSS